MIKSIKTLTINCLDIRWAIERDIALNIHWLRYLKNGRKIQIKGENVVLYLWIYLRHVIVYGFDYRFLKLISSVLSNWKHRTKINSSFSEWKHLLIGVPQGSVLGPLLFNIYMCDLFLFISESNVANYTDDTTLYACGKTYVMCKKIQSLNLYFYLSGPMITTLKLIVLNLISC